MKTSLTTVEDKQLQKLHDAGEAFARALGLKRGTSFTDTHFVAFGVLVANREELAEALEEVRAYSKQSRLLRVVVFALALVNLVNIWMVHR